MCYCNSMAQRLWQSTQGLHPARGNFTPANIYCIINPQTTKVITLIFVILSFCQRKNKGHLKAWVWRAAFPKSFCCKETNHYQGSRNCSRGWNYNMLRGVVHVLRIPQGVEVGQWLLLHQPGQGTVLPILGDLQGRSCSLWFIWARAGTAEPHWGEWPWTVGRAALQIQHWARMQGGLAGVS